MKGILITSEKCPPCADMKEELAPLIASGEIEVVDFEKEPERVTELMNKYDVTGMPGLLIMGSNGQLIATN
jgi:thioredoxin-related protein